MKLGLNLGYMVGSDDPSAQLRLAQRAEELGFDSVWAAEAYGSDSPTVLAWLAGQARRISIGSAVMQIPGRTPAMTAMTAASLDLLTGGRFRLGLGVSGPQVSEGWHGARFNSPLGRTREYVEIVRQAFDRKTLTYDGRHYQLPLPDGPGKPLKLTIAPASDRIAVYLAAVGPKNVELAGEIADGWLAVFFAPGYADEQFERLRAGRAKRADTEGPVDPVTLADFDVVATIPLVVGDDPARCAEPVRRYAALYVGGMDSREQNFYNALAARMGYEAAAAEVQELFLTGRQREAAAAVPFDFIDQTSLLGDGDRLTERLRLLADAGVTTCAVTPFGRTIEEKLDALTVLARAYEQASVG